MFPMFRLFTALIVLVIASAWLYRSLEYGPLPNLDPDEWWGPEELRSNDTRVRPFRVEFSEEMIADLKRRLHNFRAPPPPLEGVAFEYGFNSNQLNKWRAYWIDHYSFKDRETFLNQFPQYKTNVQGLDIHFIRVIPEPPSGVEVLPLLLLHGWPGSVREFYNLIPLLTRLNPGYDFLFEVIAPSLPGFAYSDAAVRPGLGSSQMAVILRNLMHRLGHKQFYIQAGDWGAEVASDLVTLYPEEVLGFHTNLPIVKHPLALLETALAIVFPSWFLDPSVADRTDGMIAFISREVGYFTMHSTKPDTIAVGVTDSPLGLLAYILEKVSIATNPTYLDRPDGGLEEKFTKDELLDNLMMTWATGSIASSFRLYREGMTQVVGDCYLNIRPTQVPTWVMQAKHEILYQTPHAIRYKFPNLVNVTVLQEGGHFIALEAPEALAKDIFTAVESFRKLL